MIFSAIIRLDDVEVEANKKWSGITLHDGEAHVRFNHPHDENPWYLVSIIFDGGLIITNDAATSKAEHPIIRAIWAAARESIEARADEMAERGSDTW